MHPVEKKNRLLTIITVSLAIFIASFVCIKSPPYIIVLVTHGLFWLNNRNKIKRPIILTSIYSTISCITIFTIEHVFIKNIFPDYYNASISLILSFAFSMLLLMIPYYFIFIYFNQALSMAEIEKENYDIFSKYPLLVCKEHLTKTTQTSRLGYKKVDCRIDGKCYKKNNLVNARLLIGLIGKLNNGRVSKNDYYVTLWDHKEEIIKDGDFDIIEIHENKKIEDYNFVIAKLIDFFYNDLDRYKPINEIHVRIFGNPSISESTKRLMEKRFSNIEFL